MILDEDSLRLARHLTHELNALAAPLDESIRMVWRGGGAPEGRSVLDNQLLLLAQRFIDLRDAADGEKQRYYEEVCRLFRVNAAANTFPLLTRATGLPAHLQKKLDNTPVAVSYLDTHDARRGTSYAARARHALFQFANLVIKSDGRITPAEEAALTEFKRGLFPAGAAPGPKGEGAREAGVRQAQAAAGAAGAAPVDDEKPARTLEELLAELDALVGLEGVKRDVRQLANFLKVQRMREARN
jgi:hypothetical protein